MRHSKPLAVLLALAGVAACKPSVVGGGGPSTGAGGPPIAVPVTGGAGGAPSSTGGAGGAGGGGTGAGGSGTLTVLATGLNQPTFIALAGGSVFVTEHGNGPPNGALVKIPKAGGALDRVVPNQPTPWAIGVADGYVYWSNYGSGDDGEIRRFSLADQTVDTLATGLGYPWALGVNAGSVYWTDSFTSRLLAVRPDQTEDVLATDQGIPSPLAVDDTGLYYGVQGSSPPSDSPIRHLSPSGTTDLYTGVERSHAIALDADYLYFGTDDGVIRRGTRSGDPAWVLATGQGQTWGFALADGYLFYTSLFDGIVARVPVAGGSVEVLATGQQYPEGIAVDADAIYWVNQMSGEVMRLAR